jgi:hypothetical protein
MNDVSSRSHAVFIIIVEQMTSIDDGGSEGAGNSQQGTLSASVLGAE